MSHAQGTDLADECRNANTDAANPPNLPPNTGDTDIDVIFEKLNGSGAHACYCRRSEDGGCECALKDEYLVEAKAAIEQKLNAVRMQEISLLAKFEFPENEKFSVGRNWYVADRIAELQATKETL